MQRRKTTARTALNSGRGFSLIEMMIALAVLLVMAAIVTPLMSNMIAGIKLRYSATDLSGLMQKARIEAVRKNTFYPILQTTLAAGDVAYYVDLAKSGTFAAGDPLVEMGDQVNVHAGPGSGAPGETAFTTSLNFALDASGVAPNFNARGLPCLPAGGGTTCPAVPGQGFIYFLSRNNALGTTWASVVVTPSGRVQVWAYDGTNWNNYD
jgi:prepilin-type N-terminal cleavage/methylation domain-containing protein